MRLHDDLRARLARDATDAPGERACESSLPTRGFSPVESSFCRFAISSLSWRTVKSCAWYLPVAAQDARAGARGTHSTVSGS